MKTLKLSSSIPPSGKTRSTPNTVAAGTSSKSALRVSFIASTDSLLAHDRPRTHEPRRFGGMVWPKAASASHRPRAPVAKTDKVRQLVVKLAFIGGRMPPDIRSLHVPQIRWG